MEKQDFASVTVFTENTLEKTDTDGSSTSENTSAHHHPRYCNPDDPFDCHPRWKDAHFRQRPIWFHKADPILTHIAFAVDFANVAAFSYLSVAYGGPAFLVPYFFFLVVCAFPILYMEVVLGQFLREGLISVWKIVPILKGIGYSLTMIITTLMMYYLTPVAWALVYLSGCFEEPLPWIHCDHPWNTIKCTTIEPDHFFSNNKTDLDPKKPTPALEYFKGRVLQIYSSPYSDPHMQKVLNEYNETYGFLSQNGLGPPSLELTMYMAGVVGTMFIVLNLSIKWTGKLCRFTSTFPYAVLAILFFRGIVLDGALDAIRDFFVYPTPAVCSEKVKRSPEDEEICNKSHWDVLTNQETWIMGAIQVFFSLGSGFGVHLTISSHNPFKQNILRDCLITTAANTVMSLLSLLTLVEYCGYLTYIKREDASTAFLKNSIIEVVFVMMPDAMGQLPGAWAFNGLFFLMIILILYDSYVIGLHAVIVGFADEFRHWFPKGKDSSDSSRILAFFVVALAFVMSLISLTRGGLWFYTFLDAYAAGVPLCSAILIQTVAVSWIWGMEDLCDAVETMTGTRPGLYLRLCWKYFAPCTLSVVLYFSLGSDPPKVEGKDMPPSAVKAGNVLKFLPIILIPVYAVYQIVYHHKSRTLKEKIWMILCPEEEHEQIIANGNTGNRLTLKHLFYFGPIFSRSRKVVAAPSFSVDFVPSKRGYRRKTVTVMEILGAKPSSTTTSTADASQARKILAVTEESSVDLATSVSFVQSDIGSISTIAASNPTSSFASLLDKDTDSDENESLVNGKSSTLVKRTKSEKEPGLLSREGSRKRIKKIKKHRQNEPKGTNLLQPVASKDLNEDKSSFGLLSSSKSTIQSSVKKGYNKEKGLKKK